MAGLIYGLCTLTAFLCAWLLLQAHRQSRYTLLLWGGLCFAGLTLSHALLVIDKLVFPMFDFSTARYLITLISMFILLYGLIWDTK